MYAQFHIHRLLRAALFAACLGGMIVSSPSCCAADDGGPPSPTVDQADAVGDDELWFVSSRSARFQPEGPAGLQVWKYDGAGNWNSASLDDLAAADPSRPVCFHVHGNRVAFGQSNYGGWRFYESLADDCTEREPLRFVIFSWPSERINGSQRDDVRAKAAVAERHAYYLAEVLRRLPAESRVSLIGYSYGARLIGGALHLLGGGSLRGRSLDAPAAADPHRMRAVFLAGALDSGSFLPGCTFDEAPRQIDRLLVCRNTADKVLKWYPLLYKFMLHPSRGVQAMGYAGAAGSRSVPELVDRIECVDVSCLVGNVHEWHGFEYLCGSLLPQMREFVSFAEADKPITAAD